MPRIRLLILLYRFTNTTSFISAIVVLHIMCLAITLASRGERADAEGHDSTLRIFETFQRRRHLPNSDDGDSITYIVNSLTG